MMTSLTFWVALLIISAVVVVFLLVTKNQVINNPVVAGVLALLFALGYFHMVNTSLMDMQGLDYWYLFRG